MNKTIEIIFRSLLGIYFGMMFAMGSFETEWAITHKLGINLLSRNTTKIVGNITIVIFGIIGCFVVNYFTYKKRK